MRRRLSKAKLFNDSKSGGFEKAVVLAGTSCEQAFGRCEVHAG